VTATGYDEHARARQVSEPPKAGGAPRAEFQRDRARVLHSAALRRLAAKTQVVLAGTSDFPRTRLTHSLECAQIGRELGASLGADPDLVDAACLAHDLGHPPFGHNGETALDVVARSCGGFEGNAQSFRVLSRLEAKTLTDDGRSAGLNLTRAALDAATKYPWPKREGLVKYGVYADDATVFDWVREGALADRRCLEAQVMDWADDVAYSVHDLEDGLHSGQVPPTALADADDRAEIVRLAASTYFSGSSDELTAAAERLVALPVWLRSFDGSLRAVVAAKRLTSELIARLSAAAIDATRASYGADSLTRYGADVVVPEWARAECAILKGLAHWYVMRREETLALQSVQRAQLEELAAAVWAAAPDSLEPRLRSSWAGAFDDGARLRVVVDQVASLTDTSAAAWHRRWVRRS
jgi:dGTPase